MKDLLLAEKFLLLALDNEKGKFVTDSQRLKYGVSGALLLDLSLAKAFELFDKNVFFGLVNKQMLKAKKGGVPEDELLKELFQVIAGHPEGKALKTWIRNLSSSKYGLREELIARLKAKGIIAEKEKHILWVFPVSRYPEKNPQPENEVRNHLFDIVQEKAEPEPEDMMLLALVYHTKLLKEIFGNAPDYKHIRKKVKKLIEEEPISKGVDEIVQEINAAVVAAAAASASAAAASSSS